MKLRFLLLAAAIGSSAGCCTLLGEIPGIFYDVHLRDAPPPTVCLAFAQELVTDLQLQIAQTFPFSKHNCNVDLGSGKHEVVGISSDPQNRRLGISVQTFGFGGAVVPTSATRDLASRVLTVTQKYFPGAAVTESHPCRGPFAP